MKLPLAIRHNSDGVIEDADGDWICTVSGRHNAEFIVSAVNRAAANDVRDYYAPRSEPTEVVADPGRTL